MQIEHHIASLVRHGTVIVESLSDLAAEDASWRPEASQWSLLEIAAHLLDEEREDFRVRLDHTLHRPGVAWPSIDPPGWVTERAYADRDLDEILNAFRNERAKSITWLRDQSGTDWNLAYAHPLLGTIRAGDLLSAWVGHDLLHLRQILHRTWSLAANRSRPYVLDYAGTW